MKNNNMKNNNMKIVVAPDSFKGSLSSVLVADNIEKGIKKIFPDANVIKIPIADGGEGTVEALITGAGGQYYTQTVKNPIFVEIKAEYGILNNGTAVIEMAAASGLPLISDEKRNPLVTTTYGTGQLIKAALDRGCANIIIGLGGSATNDGGVGMAQALGALFYDKAGKEIEIGGGSLINLETIDLNGLDPRIAKTIITIASDVNSPLYGTNGATVVFAPQKGADAQALEVLEKGLIRLAEVSNINLGKDYSKANGSGAAGGLGFGLMTFCGATIKPGIEIIMDMVNINSHLENATLVITGEGRIDKQSVMGKVPTGIAMRAKEFSVPVLAIVGSIGEGADAVYDYGIDSIMSTVKGIVTLEDAFCNSAINIEDATARAMRMLKIGMNI